MKNPIVMFLSTTLVMSVIAAGGVFAQSQSVPQSASVDSAKLREMLSQVRPTIVKHSLLHRDDVRTDLELSAAQIEGIEALAQLVKDARELLPADVVADLSNKVGEQSLALLTNAQLKRIDQISRQLLRATIWSDPKVLQELELTDAQKEELATIQGEYMQARRASLGQSDRSDLEKAKTKMESQTMAVLNEEQQRLFEDLIGKPFVADRSQGIALTMAGPRNNSNNTRRSPAETNNLSRGMPAPDFTALTPDGKEVQLSDYRGQVVVIDFWATWCGPCLAAMPGTEALQRATKDQDVVVLAVCVGDERANFDQWVEKNGEYTVQFLFDPAGREAEGIRDAYGVKGIPSVFVIDEDGKIVGNKTGSNSSSSASGDQGWDGTLGTIDPRLANLMRAAGIELEADRR